MSVKFKTIERGEPGVSGGGQKKFYATAVSNGEANIDGLTKNIEKISTVSGADIRAVLYGLVDIMPGELGNGKIVRVGDLGNFRISISSEGHDTADEVTANSIKNVKIIFTPGKKLKDLLNTLEFSKIKNTLP